MNIKKRNYVVIGILLVLLVPLQVSLWSDDGVLRWFELNNLIKEQRSKNFEMKERAEVLKVKVLDLKESKGAIENMAREESQMIKKDETFYRVIYLPKEDKQ